MHFPEKYMDIKKNTEKNYIEPTLRTYKSGK